ncbi:VOC family protein [Paenibacillus sophorae]|uniref:VOC family protein n=1 Tax=Paenibacillus sophorae TaxID=1333845 RepID=UPI0020C89111|nr:VOC family protein [Paenibacillus sophorae]
MTTIHWDHTVHYVNDLDKAIKTFQESGLDAFHGGSHKLWGTFMMRSRPSRDKKSLAVSLSGPMTSRRPQTG